jgi:L-2-hydroxycarboxylate dehydrogenase (NAD+)
LGWATDEYGRATSDAHRVLENFKRRAGGGLLPLGGEGELLSGHKGYGLALLVEILGAILSGAAYADLVYPKTSDGQPLPANLGHFFGAWRVDAFRPIEEFTAAMDDLQQRLKNAAKVEGQERIYIHGEKEYENAERYLRDGIPLNPKAAADMRAIASELRVAYDLE